MLRVARNCATGYTISILYLESAEDVRDENMTTYSAIIRHKCARLGNTSDSAIRRSMQRDQVMWAFVDELDDIDLPCTAESIDAHREVQLLVHTACWPSAGTAQRPERRPNTTRSIRHVCQIENEKTMSPPLNARQANAQTA